MTLIPRCAGDWGDSERPMETGDKEKNLAAGEMRVGQRPGCCGHSNELKRTQSKRRKDLQLAGVLDTGEAWSQVQRKGIRKTFQPLGRPTQEPEILRAKEPWAPRSSGVG